MRKPQFLIVFARQASFLVATLGRANGFSVSLDSHLAISLLVIFLLLNGFWRIRRLRGRLLHAFQTVDRYHTGAHHSASVIINSNFIIRLTARSRPILIVVIAGI